MKTLSEKESSFKNHFTDSVFYEIELTAKYCKMLGSQIFEKFNIDISIEEFGILDTLLCNPGICQRDLARIILRDRANTGKLLDSLEKKELVRRELAIKNNRPVKLAQLTEKGYKKTKEVTDIIRPHLEDIRKRVKNKDLDKVTGLLKQFREILREALEIQI